MKVTVNVEDLKRQIEEHKKTIRRKLENTVKIYAYNLAMESVLSTPVGSIENHMEMYRTRPTDILSMYKLSKAPGNARGGWQLTYGGPPSQKYTGFADTEGMFMSHQLRRNSEESYKLGQSVFVTNYVPYVANDNFYVPGWTSLQNGRSNQAPNGIREPVEEVMKAFRVNLQRIFDQS